MRVSQLRIEDVCDFVGGSQPPKSEFINTPKEGYVRLIQTRDYKTDAFPTYIQSTSTKKFCDDKDIMIGRYGPPIFQICRGLIGAYNVALIKAKPRQGIDREYLYYFLKQDAVFQYVDKLSARTGGQTGVDLVSLNKYPISLPEDILDQQKLVSVLSALDAKIDCNSRINAELEAMAKTLYDYWFVQFDFPDANGEPYKSSGGKMVYNAKLKREIPVGWCDAVVADVLDKSPTSTKILNSDIREFGVIPVIDQSQSYICGFTDEMASQILPVQPHVVFGDHTRVIKLVNFSYARGADGTQILSSKDIRMPGYLMYQVVSDIDLSSYGYARHFKFLKESKIILPDQGIAQKYHATVAPWFEKRRVSIFENLELARFRDWLLPLLMNGQVTLA